MIPETQSVYRVEKIGSLDNLKKVTEKVEKPEGNEVLVNVKSVSLNSRDLQVIEGNYIAEVDNGVIPCSDMSGVVVAIGDKVTDVKVGDEVVSNFTAQNVYRPTEQASDALGAGLDGCLREYVCIGEQGVNKINRPEGFSWNAAASLTCTGVTSWNALFGLKRLGPGDVVLCIGTGGVALTALSIAKAAGALTIITSSKDEKLEMVKREYGADHTINYNTKPDWDKKVLEISNGRGADHILETGGNGTIQQSINCIAEDGVVTIIGYMAPPPSELPDVFIQTLVNSAILRGIRVGGKHHAKELIKFVENKGLKIAVDKVFDYHKDQVHDAFNMLKSGSQVGKICITFE